MGMEESENYKKKNSYGLMEKKLFLLYLFHNFFNRPVSGSAFYGPERARLQPGPE